MGRSVSYPSGAIVAFMCNDKFGSRVTTNEMAGFHGSKRKR